MKKQPDIRQPLVEALSRSPMLRFLGRHDPRGLELRDMLESGELHQFEKGAEIITQGEESDAMYVLASGSVSVMLDGGEVCAMEQPGEVFGEFGVFTGELRTASVVAREDVTCFSVSSRFTSRKALEENSIFHHLMQQAFTKILLGRLRQSNAEIVALKQSLEMAEKQVVFLRMDNESLNLQLDRAREELKEGFRGTRGGGTKV